MTNVIAVKPCSERDLHPSIVPTRGLTTSERDPVARIIAYDSGHAHSQKTFSRDLTNPEHGSQHAVLHPTTRSSQGCSTESAPPTNSGRLGGRRQHRPNCSSGSASDLGASRGWTTPSGTMRQRARRGVGGIMTVSSAAFDAAAPGDATPSF